MMPGPDERVVSALRRRFTTRHVGRDRTLINRAPGQQQLYCAAQVHASLHLKGWLFAARLARLAHASQLSPGTPRFCPRVRSCRLVVYIRAQ